MVTRHVEAGVAFGVAGRPNPDAEGFDGRVGRVIIKKISSAWLDVRLDVAPSITA